MLQHIFLLFNTNCAHLILYNIVHFVDSLLFKDLMEDNKKFCSVRLPKDVHSLAKSEAYKSGMTLQEWILELIKYKLNL